MKINKRFLSIFLIALLTIVLAACGNTTTQAPTTQAPTTTQGVTTEAPTTTAEPTTTVDLQDLLDQLAAQYADTLDSDTYVATDNLSLVTSIGGLDITWSSNNTTYLENDGTVHRPTFTEGDQTVVLSATVTDGTNSESYTFFVTIQAMAKTDQERADEVFSVVVTFPSKEKWTSADELEFLTSGADADAVTYDVTWTSSDPDVISTDGTITQPGQDEADVDVIMTASVTINDVEYTDSYTFTVAKLESGTAVSTIAAAAALGEDTYVKIEGVTVVAIEDAGTFFITDGTDILNIYGASFDVEVGSVYDVSGVFTYYYNAPELVGATTQPLRAEPSTAAVSTAPITADTDIAGFVSGMTTPTPENPFAYQMYTITGKVWFNADSGNYSTFIVPSDYDFSADAADQASPSGDSIMIYYHTNLDIISALAGKVITVDLLTLGWRTDLSVWYAGFFGSALDVDITFDTDAEAVSTALDVLSYPENVLEDMTLNFPSELYGTTLTYSSDNTAVITDAGVVDYSSQTTQVTVTLTVTATKGTETDTRDFVIKVGEVPLSTVAEAIAAGQDAVVKVIGIITDTTDSAGYGAYWLQDATGAFDLFNPSGVFTEDMIGKTYEIIGTVDVYNGLLELKVASTDDLTELTGDDALTMPTATDLSDMTLDDATLLPYQGTLVDLTGFVIKSDMDASYTSSFNIAMVNIISGEEITVRLDKDNPNFDTFEALFAGATAGSPIDFTNIIVGWYNGAQLLIASNSVVEEGTPLTDDQKLTADKVSLDFGGNVFDATTIDLPATGSNGSTIAWAITADADSSASYDAGTGVLSIVAPTGDATVEITATLTLGDATDTAVFTYTLMAVTAVDLGDFASQAADSVVAVSGVVYAVIGNGFFMEDSTGQVFVYSYDATYSVGDEVELIGTVAFYKDSPQLTDPISLPDPLSTGNSVSMEPMMYEDGVTTLVPGQLYSVMGTVAIEGTYNNVFVYVNDTDSFEIYYKSPTDSIDALKALVGEMVVVELIYYNDSTSFVYVGGTDGVSLYADVTDFSDLFAMTDGTNYDIANGTMVTITGVVTGNSYDGLFLQDTNGVGFFMYKPDETGINIGDEATFYGEVTDYNGARQLAYGAAQLEVLSIGNALVATPVTADAIDAFGMNDAGTLYSFDGFTLAGIDGSTMTLEYTMSDMSTGTVNIRYYTNWEDLNTVANYYIVGDALPTVEFILYNFRDSLIQLDCVSVDFTDADSVQFDTENVPPTLDLYGDFVIPDSEFGSTFTVTAVSSEIAAYVDYQTTPGTLLYTEPSADVTGTITLDITKGSESDTTTITVTVKVPLAAGTYTETFTAFPETSSSYLDGSYTGDNSIMWTYKEARGDQNIDGDALCFAKSSNAYLSATISGGISSLSIEYKNAFSTAAGVEIYINDTLVGTSPEVSDKVATTYNLDLSAQNITGAFTITIKTTNGQLVIDNLTWVTNPAPAV